MESVCSHTGNRFLACNKMASQETPNYQLTRWAGTDRILMEEFNSDNEKIDAALKSNADKAAAALAAATVLEGKLGLQHIQTLTSTETARYVSFTPNIDWDQWAEVYLVVKPKFSISTTYQFYFTNSTGNTATMVNKETERMTCSILYPMFDRTAPVSGLVCGYGFFNHTFPYSVWDTLRIETSSPSSNVLPGTVIEIYGRK